MQIQVMLLLAYSYSRGHGLNSFSVLFDLEFRLSSITLEHTFQMIALDGHENHQLQNQGIGVFIF